MKFALLVSVLLSLPSYATTLRVNGQAGVNQKNEFFACRHQSNQKGEIRVQKRECVDMVLNQAKEVQPGLYYISYSNSGFIQQINEGDAAVVNLIQMKTPAINGPKYFRVFRDIMETEEQDKKALWSWGRPDAWRIVDRTKFKGDDYDKDEWETKCYREPEKAKNCVFVDISEAQACARMKSKDAKARCEARAGTDFRSNFAVEYKPKADGTYSYLSVNYAYDEKGKFIYENPDETKWSDSSRMYLAEKASIEWGWISVLPGTYGVELSDETGATMIRTGISAH